MKSVKLFFGACLVAVIATGCATGQATSLRPSAATTVQAEKIPSLHLRTRQQVVDMAKTDVKAWVDGEVCITRWVIRYGDGSRPSEKEASCENGSCCGRDSFMVYHRFPGPGQYTVEAEVSFWGKTLGVASRTINVPDMGE